MKPVIIMHSVLAIISGVLVIGYGEYDDSPGAQGIGLLTVISAMWVVFAALRKEK